MKRLSDDDRLAHVQSVVTRVSQLISDAEIRIVKHAAHMATLEKSAPELGRVSQKLHRNMEQGLRILMHNREALVRELADLERKRDGASARH